VGLIIHVDGAARGNPGPAGAGVVIRSDDGTLLFEAGYFLGKQTNNAAEYHALIRALQQVQCLGDQPICVCSDSELLVRQITGQYRVKSPTLRPFFEQTQALLLKVSCWNLRYVPREENRRADELANLAIDRQRDVIVHDVSAGQTTAAAPDTLPAEPRTTAVTTDAAAAQSTSAEVPAGAASAEHGIQVAVVRPPDPHECPAGGCAFQSLTVRSTLPAELCVHAAHAILPTLLAMLNTDPQEFAALPTMTVRCTRSNCAATFHLSPVRSSNGVPRREVE
jgi:ribonuclease HI